MADAAHIRMKIQQAIFTSSDRGQIKGYQLVAKSADIDRNLAQELCRWSPSQMASDDPERWTLNYFPVSEEFVAVSRTVLGGREYSGRGGSQVVTLIAVLHNDQFAAYQNSAVSVAQTAMAFGWMRLPLDMPSRSLEAFELPDGPLADVPEDRETSSRPWAKNVRFDDTSLETLLTDDLENSLLVEIAELLDQKRRLAVIGAPNPAETVMKLTRQLSKAERRDFSFTTGLPPAVHRPFQAHFLPQTTPVLNQMFKSEGITPIQMSHVVSNTR